MFGVGRRGALPVGITNLLLGIDSLEWVNPDNDRVVVIISNNAAFPVFNEGIQSCFCIVHAYFYTKFCEFFHPYRKNQNPIRLRSILP